MKGHPDDRWFLEDPDSWYMVHVPCIVGANFSHEMGLDTLSEFRKEFGLTWDHIEAILELNWPDGSLGWEYKIVRAMEAREEWVCELARKAEFFLELWNRPDEELDYGLEDDWLEE